MKGAALLYPRKCPFCRALVEETAWLCRDCAKELPWTGANGKTSGSFFSLCWSPLWYRGRAREALLRFKFSRRSAYAPSFGHLMADQLREKLKTTPDTVTYVPLSLPRLWRRGYSQSRLLAQAVASELGIPLERLLRKRAHRPAQSGLRDAAARRANVSGAFAPCRGAAPEGKTILLIDDVITSGATLSECSRILLTAGAERVLCATLCKAGKH
jgi:ComF family protein